MHALARSFELIFDELRRRRWQVGVGHFEHGRNPAEHGRRTSGFHILLFEMAGLAEMHMRIDDAWKHMQPARVERLHRLDLRQCAYRCDASRTHADVGLGNSGRCRANTAAKNKIETLHHRVSRVANTSASTARRST